LQRIESYTIDLTKVKGKGEFTCPKCGTTISPDDKTENVYTIVEPVVENESLKKLIIKCNSCGSQIHLTGFDLLD
jgi:DNA-directed RNA polymerase subunit RPC12/RpoP